MAWHGVAVSVSEQSDGDRGVLTFVKRLYYYGGNGRHRQALTPAISLLHSRSRYQHGIFEGPVFVPTHSSQSRIVEKRIRFLGLPETHPLIAGPDVLELDPELSRALAAILSRSHPAFRHPASDSVPVKAAP